MPDLRLAVEAYLRTEDADGFIDDILMAAPKLETWKDKVQILLSGFRHHQWMYDGGSLMKLLASRGFADVRICAAGETSITDPGNLNLYERAENTVFVEGFKPAE